MIKIKFTALLSFVLLSFSVPPDFLSSQKKYSRVKTAIKDKQKILNTTLTENGLSLNNLQILLVAYKDEDVLDVYAKGTNNHTYQKLFSYRICSRSGDLGPKRMQGDGQVPEGFYHIDRFNPASNYYLSLGINYPNTSDKRKSNAENLGGDIFIHGSCVTIGCLPMEDEIIKEIYVLAIHARQNGQMKIPVYIFPFKMTDENMKAYAQKHAKNLELLHFWNNLKIGFDTFARNKMELKFQVSKNGDYVFKNK